MERTELSERQKIFTSAARNSPDAASKSACVGRGAEATGDTGTEAETTGALFVAGTGGREVGFASDTVVVEAVSTFAICTTAVEVACATGVGAVTTISGAEDSNSRYTRKNESAKTPPANKTRVINTMS
jgi:hypothetical protein